MAIPTVVLLLLWGSVSTMVGVGLGQNLLVGFDQVTYYVCENDLSNPSSTVCVSVTGAPQVDENPILFTLSTIAGTATRKPASQLHVMFALLPINRVFAYSW